MEVLAYRSFRFDPSDAGVRISWPATEIYRVFEVHPESKTPYDAAILFRETNPGWFVISIYFDSGNLASWNITNGSRFSRMAEMIVFNAAKKYGYYIGSIDQLEADLKERHRISKEKRNDFYANLSGDQFEAMRIILGHAISIWYGIDFDPDTIVSVVENITYTAEIADEDCPVEHFRLDEIGAVALI